MELTPAERAQLAAAFGCFPDEVDERLVPFCAAAIEEYVRMMLGQRVFTRGSDVREYRLLLLIKHVFDGFLPSERTISALFQTTAAQSRSLLRAVMSKYQYELAEAIAKSLAATIASAELSADGYRYLLVSDSENVIEALNRELADADGSLPPIVRAVDTVSRYEIAPSSYEALKKRLTR